MNFEIPVEVRLKSVIFFTEKETAVILLEGISGDWGLPILAKASEAMSVARFLSSQEVPRPLSHDLLAGMIATLNARVTNILIDMLEGPLCHGIISLDVQGREKDFDSRPSDAIALALTSHVPIFVSSAVVARGAVLYSDGLDTDDWEGKTRLEN